MHKVCMAVVLFSLSTWEPYGFQVRLSIMINSKNEAARFEHAAQGCKKYRESKTAGNYTETVLLKLPAAKGTAAVSTGAFVGNESRNQYDPKYPMLLNSTRKMKRGAVNVERVAAKSITPV